MSYKTGFLTAGALLLACLTTSGALAAETSPVPPAVEKSYSMLIWFGGQQGRLSSDTPMIYGKEHRFHFQGGTLPKGTEQVRLVLQEDAFDAKGQRILAQTELVKLTDKNADFTLTLPPRGIKNYFQISVFFYDAAGKKIAAPFQTSVFYPGVEVRDLDQMRNDPAYFRDTDGRWLWQTDQAKVLPSGNLEWTPRASVENLGTDLRYIDYDGGNDALDGKTPATAWKHHPWDPEAAGLAKADASADTYLFKRGVIYRGILSGSRGGTPEKPLRLTSSSTFGTGKAILLNSSAIRSEWTQTDRKGIWKTNVGKCDGAPVVHVWRNGDLKRLWHARFPNFTYDDPDDARAGWMIIEKATQKNGEPRLLQCKTLKTVPADLKTGTLFARIDWNGVMGFPNNFTVKNLDAANGTISVNAGRSTTNDCRFYLFNDLSLLDEPGEFYYDAEKGDLYVMPESEADLKQMEFSSRRHGVSVEFAHNIEISNLSFLGGADMAYNFSCWNFGYKRPSAVRFLGCDSVTVKNCEFRHVPAGVFATSPSSSLVDKFTVQDCDFFDCGTWAIRFGEGHIYRAKLLRNRIRHTGYVASNTMTCWLDSVDQAVVAGNILEDCGGNGIDCNWGRGTGSGEIPLVRGFIFQNRVERALRLINDYGNIEVWQTGPSYIFNNLSVNPGGIWFAQINYGGSPHFGFSYYLDGGFKNYLFNNIARGVCNDGKSIASNTGAFQEIFGFNNSYFNNTASKFEVGFRRQMPEGGRNRYLGNLMDDISKEYYQLDGWRQNMTGAADKIEFGTNDYAANLHIGLPKAFGRLISKPLLTTEQEFRDALKQYKTRTADFGRVVTDPLLRDPEKLDFRPRAAHGSGVIAFVPLSLYGCVGEWNFIQPDPEAALVVTDESLYPSNEFRTRSMYQVIPRADLTLHQQTAADFIPGRCESWKAGALRFNGKDQFASCSQDAMWRDGDYRGFKFPGRQRKSFDMTTNSFVLEFVAKPVRGTLISKQDGKTGYRVRFDAGKIVFDAFLNGKAVSSSAAIPAGTPEFQHWMIELDRPAKLIRFFLEGKLVNTAPAGELVSANLSNGGDLLVGKDLTGDFFEGALDFLRFSQGSLEQSMTTAEEVHRWAFDGPNRRDFAGNPRGSAPDAGALQFVK